MFGMSKEVGILLSNQDQKIEELKMIVKELCPHKKISPRFTGDGIYIGPGYTCDLCDKELWDIPKKSKLRTVVYK